MRYWEAVNAIHQMYGIPDAGFGEVHDSFNSLEYLRSHVADLELRDRINEARKKSLKHRLAGSLREMVDAYLGGGDRNSPGPRCVVEARAVLGEYEAKH
jgi:hypothetical protein